MKSSRNEKISLLFAFLGYAIFGFSFMFSKNALAVATPFVLLAFRFTVAFIILNIFVLTKKFKINLKGKNVKLLLLLGLVHPVSGFILENYGIKLSATSYVGTIMALIPIVSIVLGFWFLGEKVKLYQIVFTLLSIVGVSITTFGQVSGEFSWLGFVLILGTVFASSMFSVLSRKISKEFTAFERTYVMFAMGCIVFVSMALIMSRNNMQEMIIAPMKSSEFWIPVIFLSTFSSVGSFFMINYAMTYLSVAQASIFVNLATVICILAGVFILGESIGVYQIIGIVIIMVSAYGVNRKRKAKYIASAETV